MKRMHKKYDLHVYICSKIRLHVVVILFFSSNHCDTNKQKQLKMSYERHKFVKIRKGIEDNSKIIFLISQ